MSRKIRESFSSISSVKEELVSIKTEIEQEVIAKGGIVTGGFSTFSTDISTIPSGSVHPFPESADVTFYDYDGTVVGRFAKAELSALPEPPDHSGDAVPLIFQGWNYSLEEIKEMTGFVEVGAIYVPADGKTHIILKVTPVNSGTFSFYFRKSVASDKLVIDFGGGVTLSDNSNAAVIFTSPSSLPLGIVEVTVWLEGGTGTYSIGQGGSHPSFTGLLGTTAAKKESLIKMFLGDRICTPAGANGAGAYHLYASLKTITIPNSETIIANYTFYRCANLNHVSIPRSATLIEAYVFNLSYGIETISIPPTVISVGNESFRDAVKLNRISLPKSVTTLGSSLFYSCSALERANIENMPVMTLPASMFYNCFSLKEITLPESLTSLTGGNEFRYCYSLRELIIPDNVTTVSTHVVGNCVSLRRFVFPREATTSSASGFTAVYAVQEYDFSKCKAVVPIGSTTHFVTLTSATEIKVPAELYATWKVATNWVAFAKYLVPV